MSNSSFIFVKVIYMTKSEKDLLFQYYLYELGYEWIDRQKFDNDAQKAYRIDCLTISRLAFRKIFEYAESFPEKPALSAISEVYNLINAEMDTNVIMPIELKYFTIITMLDDLIDYMVSKE